MNSSGYLKEIGWINSFNRMEPVDKNNKPIPWVTYPFIYFINTRLTKELEVLEFGCGNSTLWYSKKVKFVTCMEHDEVWIEKIKSAVPRNVSLNYEKLIRGGRYSKFSASQDKKFDIIIVDGRDRVNCIRNSVDSLVHNGVIILDDSERDEYINGVSYLQEKGFKMIEFWGISPGSFYKKCTTVFYKENNCLGI